MSLFKVNWLGGGYFDLIDKYIDSNSQAESSSVEKYVSSLRSSLDGDFKAVEQLADIVTSEYPSPVASASCALVGSAGLPSFIDELVEQPVFYVDANSEASLVKILVCSGRVSDAMKIFEIYQNARHGSGDWYEMYPIFISDIASSSELFDSDDSDQVIEDCLDSAKERSDLSAHIHGGLPLSRTNMKCSMLEKLHGDVFLSCSRRRLEAYFGVDCTRMYNGSGDLLSNNSGEIIESLDDDDKDVLVGSKYFFNKLVQ